MDVHHLLKQWHHSGQASTGALHGRDPAPPDCGVHSNRVSFRAYGRLRGDGAGDTGLRGRDHDVHDFLIVRGGGRHPWR